jgi:glutamate-1-semialdehyde 2,1-aminomutase
MTETVRPKAGSPRERILALTERERDTFASSHPRSYELYERAGHSLFAAAMRTALSRVLTEEAFRHTVPLAERFERGVKRAIEESGAPWNVVRLGCRVKYGFSPVPPSNGGQAAASHDDELETLLHLYALNRGVLITPFHNMALMAPTTTEAQVDRHTVVFSEALEELYK